jgi:hypothetical protein
MEEGTLTKTQLKILEKNREEDMRRIKEIVYEMNGGPQPIYPVKDL